MSRAKSWGDELSLRALSDTFCVVVHVVTSTDENWHILYEPSQRSVTSVDAAVGVMRHIFLSYISPVHYNAITTEVYE